MDATVVFIEDDTNNGVHFMVAREQFPRLPVVGEIVDIDVKTGAVTADYVRFRVKDVRWVMRGGQVGETDGKLIDVHVRLLRAPSTDPSFKT